MLTAVWVAVVAFVIGVGVAVYVMLKAARLMTESSAAAAGLRKREDLLLERASATIDRAGEQIARTETITATMDGVTASMEDVTASMAELRDRVVALTPPAAPPGTDGTSGALTWTAALVYGIARALGRRGMSRFRAARYRLIQGPEPGAQRAAVAAGRRPAISGHREAPAEQRPALTGRRVAAISRHVAPTGRRAAATGQGPALNGRRDGISP